MAFKYGTKSKSIQNVFVDNPQLQSNKPLSLKELNYFGKGGTELNACTLFSGLPKTSLCNHFP